MKQKQNSSQESRPWASCGAKTPTCCRLQFMKSSSTPINNPLPSLCSGVSLSWILKWNISQKTLKQPGWPPRPSDTWLHCKHMAFVNPASLSNFSQYSTMEQLNQYIYDPSVSQKWICWSVLMTPSRMGDPGWWCRRNPHMEPWITPCISIKHHRWRFPHVLHLFLNFWVELGRRRRKPPVLMRTEKQLIDTESV